MNYTKQEATLIATAICDAWCDIDRAYALLLDFHERWFETAEPSKEMLFDMEKRYELVSAHIMSIIAALHDGKQWLDAFCAPYSKVLPSKVQEAEILKQIISASKE